MSIEFKDYNTSIVHSHCYIIHTVSNINWIVNLHNNASILRLSEFGMKMFCIHLKWTCNHAKYWETHLQLSMEWKWDERTETRGGIQWIEVHANQWFNNISELIDENWRANESNNVIESNELSVKLENNKNWWMQHWNVLYCSVNKTNSVGIAREKHHRRRRRSRRRRRRVSGLTWTTTSNGMRERETEERIWL